MASTTETVTIVSLSIQALATVVLVGVTLYYAVQTKRTVQAMDRNAKTEFLPIIMIGQKPLDSGEQTMKIRLENVGKGLAKRPVKVICPGVAPIFVNSISPRSVDPEGSQDVTIKYDTNYILSLPETERLLVIEYEDVFGRNLKTEAHLEERHNLGKNANERGMSWDVWSPVLPETN